MEVIEITDDDNEDEENDENDPNLDHILDDILVEQKITKLLSYKKVNRHIRYKIKF